jgi:acyl-CoA reductase-like NAD-dependent aldehyde dehydrogenase
MTGRRISIAAAESNLKKVTLELGGKSPSLIFESANIEEAADWSALGIWFNSGQDCTAGSRVSGASRRHSTLSSSLGTDTAPFVDIRPRKHLRDVYCGAEEEGRGMCYRTGRSFRLFL